MDFDAGRDGESPRMVSGTGMTMIRSMLGED